ncbi:MAG: PKD domain-containing protein [Flavobacteriales bacterium]
MRNGTLWLLLLFVTWFSDARAQLQNNQWRFGFNSAIDFNTDPPGFPTGTALPTVLPPFITGEQIEGTASIADRNSGELLFYTDGVTVWNALNQPMPNGSELGGSDVLSAYNAAVIFPVPGSCTAYYVFCIDDYEEGCSGVTYSVVDMSLDNGLGDVDPDQKGIPLYDNETELLLAYPNNTGDGYWVLTNGSDQVNPSLAAFEVTSAGVNPNPVISPMHINGTGKMNYQGTRLACTGIVDPNLGEILGFMLYDFNSATGEISNPVNVPFLVTGDVLQYFEFTFDGNYLYAGANFSLYQFDLTSNDPATIAASAAQVPLGNQVDQHAAVQLGPDGNLYCVVGSTLYRIENPDTGFPVGPITALPPEVTPFFCLPQWIHLTPAQSPEFTISLAGDSCVQSAQVFTISNTSELNAVQWNFGDPDSGPDNTSSQFSPSHVFSGPGVYTVSAIAQSECVSDTLSLAVEIILCDFPCEAEITVVGDSCVQNPVLFFIGSDSDVVSANWNFGDENSGVSNTSTLLNPAHLFSVPGVYEIEAIVTLSCGSDTLSKTLEVVSCSSPSDDCAVYVPNAVTPNFDGVNDVFVVSAPCIFEQYECIIFNRWGDLVFRSSSPDEGWFGQAGEYFCPDGIYGYLINYTLIGQPARIIRGHLNLLR